MQLEDLGVVGNCQFSALIDNRGEVVWCCLPRFDSDPICSTLLDSTMEDVFASVPRAVKQALSAISRTPTFSRRRSRLRRERLRSQISRRDSFNMSGPSGRLN